MRLASAREAVAPDCFMPRLFVGNFDFEHRLACGDGTLPRSVARINAELPAVWATIAEAGDAVWTPAPIDPAVFDRLAGLGLPRLTPVTDPTLLPGWYEAVFWGVNDWAASSARRWCLRHDACDPSIVRRVNSRRFKLALERRHEIELPGSSAAKSHDELTAEIKEISSDSWVLKGEFGGAGREVRFGTGPPTAADLAWAGNRFRRGLAVTVEPRLDSVEEAGLQYLIQRGGDVVFDGETPLLTRPAGGYLGSRFDADQEITATWREAIEFGTRIAEGVAAEGYFGPLGIDAMRYRAHDGSIRLRPLQDLNARYTMGRLALGLRRYPEVAAACGGIFRPGDFQAADPEPLTTYP